MCLLTLSNYIDPKLINGNYPFLTLFLLAIRFNLKAPSFFMVLWSFLNVIWTIDSGISPLPFYLPSGKLEWINQFLFWNFFQLLYKNKKTEVGKWHQISGEPVSIHMKSMLQIMHLLPISSPSKNWIDGNWRRRDLNPWPPILIHAKLDHRTAVSCFLNFCLLFFKQLLAFFHPLLWAASITR